ncbi:MAG: biotin carboxylase N-terminal domain-containing protein [Breznakibacter sp.]
MIKSLLIANRGEIAVRIARTARRMGIRTYAVRTDKEPDAAYLSAADDAIDFPGGQSHTPEFLDMHTLVSLAKQHRIQAIHPGYGYLSENARFAELCRQQRIVFVGPPAEAIAQMGDKTTARAIAVQCGVPVPGGSPGTVPNVGEALAVARKIGYPVIVKAVSGGGGRGMRIVQSEADMPAMFALAANEAQVAFNDPSLFMEKYLDGPRHIEVQIVGDAYGHVIHLGERECSIQRKHQKLVEEAPSPALDDTLRQRMGEAAVKLAKAVGYQSLGTVEFLLDPQGGFYFMEMNTRIQVEHPVTEMVTGLDLVELQLLVASKARLPLAQDQVKFNGWAIECRINAEDPQAGFTPCTGKVRGLRIPQSAHVRIDTGIRQGSEITPWFDSMVAKLIVHAPDRAKAIDRSLHALDRFHVKGIKTTVPFAKAVLNHPVFRSGKANTSFVDTQMTDTVHRAGHEELLAALLVVYNHLHDTTPPVASDTAIDPWVLNKRIKNL